MRPTNVAAAVPMNRRAVPYPPPTTPAQTSVKAANGREMSMKRVLAAILKVIAVVVLLVGALLYVIANYSDVTQELTCQGYWKDSGAAEVAHMQLVEYRWWLRLWWEGDGNVMVQTEKRALAHYFPRVRKIGDGSLAIYEFYQTMPADFRGGYRAANGEVTIKFSDDLIFVGTSCRPRT
jgi:hypothetical protein